MSASRLVAVAPLDSAALAQSVGRLAVILHACVHEGASVGFVLPFGVDEARAYWRDKVAPPHAAWSRLVLIASLGDDIAGTAQLDLDSRRASAITPKSPRFWSSRNSAERA